MSDISLGKVYYIKNGKTLIEDATVSRGNLDRQVVPGLSRRVTLYSDRELFTNNKNLDDIYKQFIDDNYTVIRCLHPGISDMGKINVLPEYDTNIYIPYKPSIEDIDNVKEVLDTYKGENEFAFKIYNDCKSDYDLYDYGYNYSDNQRSVSGICEYFYKEKLAMLNAYEQEMFNKYRNYDLNGLILEDYYKYALNNRNTAVVIITPDKMIKKTVIKSFHKREILASLSDIYQIDPFVGKDEIAKLVALLKHCKYTKWHDGAYDIIPKVGGKKAGIKAVLDHYGIELAETMAFGDGHNDLEMLEYVGTGICMANGHPETLERSDYVTDTVENDGIVKALSHFGLID